MRRSLSAFPASIPADAPWGRIRLTAHTKIEEEHFYPFLRDADPDAFGSLLDEAEVEHASAKDLIAQLGAMNPGDALYDAHFTVLGEYTNHYIAEEEDELFRQVIEKEVDLRTLEKPMEDTKRQALAAKAHATTTSKKSLNTASPIRCRPSASWGGTARGCSPALRRRQDGKTTETG